MAEKIKVYDLAAELGMHSIELVQKLQEIGIDVKSHMSSITPEDAKKVKSRLRAKPEEKEAKVVKGKAVPEKGKIIIRRKKKEAEEEKEKEKEKEKEPPAPEVSKEKVEEKVERKPVTRPMPPGKIKEEEERGRREKKKVRTGKRERKLEVINVYEVKKQVRGRVAYGVKKKPLVGREQKKTLITTPKAIKRKIKLTSPHITISDLAKEMSVKATELIRKLFAMGTIVTAGETIDFDTATLIASEFSYEIEYVGFGEEAFITAEEDKAKDMKPRSPVVTMMGHVDHGKTSILDAVRKTDVASGEAGGITQHIGAYEVELKKGTITFIDTPGHEAFTQMRARGSQVTDIVVLVVAADDGVMPQTKESIDHARAAGVEIVVALNKMDKSNANPDMVKKQLAEIGLLSEDWGGQTMLVPVSAKEGTGIKELMDAILLQAEIMEIKANPDRAGEGVVIEARLDKGMGPVATVIAQMGTLKTGDYVVAGLVYGRIRSIRDSHGEVTDSIIPGRAGELVGINSVPLAGDRFNCVSSESDARKLVQYRIEERRREETVEGRKPLSLDDVMQSIGAGETKELKLVVKADTQGSIEALNTSLDKLSDEDVSVNIIHSGVGGVTVNDVNLAIASGAAVIAFNVRPDNKAQEEAERTNLDIRFYTVIYNCLEDIENVKTGMLEPVEVEKVNGQAEVRQLFNVTKVGTIAGCGVKTGKIIRNSMLRVIRDGVVVYTGKIRSLRHFKDDVKEVKTGLECGIGIEGFNDIKPGDVLESFSIEKVAARPTGMET